MKEFLKPSKDKVKVFMILLLIFSLGFLHGDLCLNEKAEIGFCPLGKLGFLPFIITFVINLPLIILFKLAVTPMFHFAVMGASPFTWLYGLFGGFSGPMDLLTYLARIGLCFVIGFIPYLLYWWILSCILIWIYNKLKNR